MKKRNTRIAALALSLVLAASMNMNAAVFAEDEPILISPAPTADETAQAPEMLTSFATVKSVENGQITATVGETTVVFNTSNETVFLGSDFSATDISALKEGTLINVVHSPIATRSIPAQMFADVVVTAESETDYFVYVKADGVTFAEDGSATVGSMDGEYVVNVPADTRIIPNKTKNILGIDDLSTGDKLICKVKDGVMTLSLPAGFTAEKIFMIENALSDKTAEDGGDVVISKPEENLAEYIASTATVESVADGTVTAIDENGMTVEVKYDGNTAFLDGKLSLIEPSALEKGDLITVVHLPIMTMSLPAQISAKLIVAEKSDAASGAVYVEVKSCEFDADGNLVIESIDGEYIVTAVKDSAVKPLYTKNIVKLTDISAGDKILCIANDGIVTMSLPAKLSTSNILLMENKTENDKYVDENGVALVPLRKKCEKLGIALEWNGEEKSVTLDGKVKIVLGDNSCTKDGEKVELPAKAVLVSDKTNPGYGLTYVPEELFDVLAK